MSRRVAILGCGKIGESLLAGLLSSGWREPDEVVATCRREERASELRDRFGVESTLANREAVAGAGLVVIAVKPQDFESLLGEVGPALSPDQTVLSVAAAIPTAAIERHLAGAVPVVRSMPNAPAVVHEGIAGICAGSAAQEEHLALAEECLSHLGRVVRVAERYMDAVTAVSGSGPAYFALLAEAMIEAGILLGLSREISTQLVVQTMFGTAKLLRDENVHPVELREAVTSPGGTTIRAIRELERAGVRAAFLNAIQAAMERSQELAEEPNERRRRDPGRRRRRRLPRRRPPRPVPRRPAPAATSASPAAPARAPPTSGPGSSSPSWGRVELWWIDDRCVPPADGRSNYRIVRESLLDGLARPPAEVHRVRGELVAGGGGGRVRRGARRRRAHASRSWASGRTATRRRSSRTRRRSTTPTAARRRRGRLRAVRPARDDDAPRPWARPRRCSTWSPAGARPTPPHARSPARPPPTPPASLVRGRETIASSDRAAASALG